MFFERELDFKVGNGLFRKLWVTAPSSTQASDGLGPLFNARSCQNCHLKDGRAPSADRAGRPGGRHVPAALGAGRSTPSCRPAIAAVEGYLATLPEPTYGGQLQNFAVPGLAAEGRMAIDYTEDAGDARRRRDGVAAPADATRVADLAYGPAAPTCRSRRGWRRR